MAALMDRDGAHSRIGAPLMRGYAGGHPDFAARAGPERIRLMHVHENHGQADEHLAVGAGALDFASFTEGWSFTLAVECKQPEETLAGVKELRRLFDAARVPDVAKGGGWPCANI